VNATVAAPRTALLVTTAGCAALTARPLLLAADRHPAAVLAGLFAILLAVSVAWPVAVAGTTPPLATGTTQPPSAVVPTGGVFALGMAAFALGRLLSTGAARPAPMALALVLNTLAAVAEEAFFRRLVYGTLLRAGTAAAVIGSAVAFAAVHVTVYGPWVLPLDLAAGLVLSWQRWASGSWHVPAVTHVVANLLVVL
jgi:membrane protease YdiL (CAAX protease family)